jgi:tol-pal system protein YbgF
MVLRGRFPVVALAAFGVLGSSACASSSSFVTRDEYVALQERVEEVERTNGRLRIQLRDAEDKIYLLEDRVESARINALRTPGVWVDPRQRAVQRPPSGTQTPITSAPSPVYRSPVTQAGPPPNAHIDPLAPPSDLPVVSAAPAAPAVSGSGEQVADGGYEVEEAVIDMARYEERFGGEPGGARPTVSSSASPASAPVAVRTAQPPVDVGGHRLPVSSDSENRVVRAEQASEPVEGRTSREVYEAAIEQFNRAEYPDALASLDSFMGMNPAVDYMDNALFWTGECYYGLGQYAQALSYFQRVVSEFPNGNKVPDSMLKIALTHERLSDPNAAREALQRVVDVYPTTPAAERAAERLRALQ